LLTFKIPANVVKRRKGTKGSTAQRRNGSTAFASAPLRLCAFMPFFSYLCRTNK